MANTKIELPVLVNDQIISLLVEEEVAMRAEKDPTYLKHLVEDYKKTSDEENCDTNNVEDADKVEKMFTWPDSAVFLLIQLYKEKEDEFAGGFKRQNVLWLEIARSMNEANEKFNLSGQQCSNKWAGLKRTYRNILDQNKKSESHRSTWPFFTAMGSILRKKVKPLSQASSAGPTPPTAMASDSQSLSDALSPTRENKNRGGKRRIEVLLENFVAEIREERKIIRKDITEQIQRREESKERRYQERKAERRKMHEERLQMQQSLMNILEKLVK